MDPTSLRSAALLTSGLALGGALGWYLASSSTASASAPTAVHFEEIDANEMDCAGRDMRRVRKAEAVVQRRTTRIVLVLERTTYAHNYSAVMRTAEALGVQCVWVINALADQPSEHKVEAGAPDETASASASSSSRRQRQRKGGDNSKLPEDRASLEDHTRFAKRACEHLWIRNFSSTAECIEALEEDGRTLWVTDLSQAAESLHSRATAAPPERLAVAFGTESTGASPTLLTAAAKRVYVELRCVATCVTTHLIPIVCYTLYTSNTMCYHSSYHPSYHSNVNPSCVLPYMCHDIHPLYTFAHIYIAHYIYTTIHTPNTPLTTPYTFPRTLYTYA